MPRIPPKCCPGFIPDCKGYGRFLLCPHALEHSLRTCTMRVHQRLAGWAARAQQRGRGRCTHAHAHSGIQAPGCGDASRFALYLEDSAEPLKTGGEGARQDLPGTLAARVPPAPHWLSGVFFPVLFRCSIYLEPCLRRAGPRTGDAQKEILLHMLFTPCFIFHLKTCWAPVLKTRRQRWLHNCARFLNFVGLYACKCVCITPGKKLLENICSALRVPSASGAPQPRFRGFAVSRHPSFLLSPS